MAKKVELLAPAGNFEKLEIAIHYGADAVYLAGKDFSLRSFSGNFTHDELHSAVQVAHQANVKVYVACNIYARNNEQAAIADYLQTLAKLDADAVIISDPGVLMLARDLIPDMPVHLSTQANTTNYNSVLFWKKLGVERVIIARELTLKEIKEMVSRCAVEIEAFVHGAMCISYSGRCLLSSFLADRDANRGQCAHPCRWKYAVVEEFRPGKYMPIAEDERGSYIFNSLDLCLIKHLPDLIEAGIHSLKIEGRMKGINYLATTVKIYRDAIDAYYMQPLNFRVKEEWISELEKINLRGYCTGFYFGNPDQVVPDYEKTKSPAGQRFAGKVLESTNGEDTGVEVRNKLFKGDAVEVFNRRGPSVHDHILDIIDPDGKSLSFAQPGNRVTLRLEGRYMPNDLIRRFEKGET